MVVNDVSGPVARLQGSRARLRWLERVRWQLGLGLLVCIFLPSAFRYALTDLWFNVAPEFNSIGAGAIAIVGGYMLLRRLHVFPGINALGYVMPCFSASFVVVILIMFIFRLDYSRLPLITSYFLALAWFCLIFLVISRYKILSLAIVPGGEAEKVGYLDNVAWHLLSSPDEQPFGCDGIVVDLSVDHLDEWERFIAEQALSGTRVYDVKQVIEQLTGRAEIDRLSLNTLGYINPNEAYFKIKQIAEWSLAAITLVLLSSVFVIVAIAIKIDSKGPVFFRQTRIGFRGKPFRVFKFRTMVHAPAAAVTADGSARNSAMTLPGDSRITRVGSFLRRTRLDEVPQLLNVLLGHMGWIGPRPEAAPLTEWYEKELPFYHYRHIVRPGITGWAQVRQGHVVDVNDVRDKLYYDFYYIKNYSFWLDLLILMMTVKIVLTGQGAK